MTLCGVPATERTSWTWTQNHKNNDERVSVSAKKCTIDSDILESLQHLQLFWIDINWDIGIAYRTCLKLRTPMLHFKAVCHEFEKNPQVWAQRREFEWKNKSVNNKNWLQRIAGGNVLLRWCIYIAVCLLPVRTISTAPLSSNTRAVCGVQTLALHSARWTAEVHSSAVAQWLSPKPLTQSSHSLTCAQRQTRKMSRTHKRHSQDEAAMSAPAIKSDDSANAIEH